MPPVKMRDMTEERKQNFTALKQEVKMDELIGCLMKTKLSETQIASLTRTLELYNKGQLRGRMHRAANLRPHGFLSRLTHYSHPDAPPSQLLPTCCARMRSASTTARLLSRSWCQDTATSIRCVPPPHVLADLVRSSFALHRVPIPLAGVHVRASRCGLNREPSSWGDYPLSLPREGKPSKGW